MTRTEHIRLMAKYNEWMNAKLCEAAKELSDQELGADRKAFFGSILGTFNHLIVADTIWLKRFATHPANYPSLAVVQNFSMPTSLNQLVFTDIQSFSERRTLLDQTIIEWANSITDQDLDFVLSYSNMKNVPAKRNFYSLLVHFFNHQTHHRGQATTLLSQAGINVGVTDMLTLIPDETLT